MVVYVLISALTWCGQAEGSLVYIVRPKLKLNKTRLRNEIPTLSGVVAHASNLNTLGGKGR